MDIYLKTETCDAIRAAAPKFGLVAAPKNETPMSILADPNTEIVYLPEGSDLENLFKTTPLEHDEQALLLVL